MGIGSSTGNVMAQLIQRSLVKGDGFLSRNSSSANLVSFGPQKPLCRGTGAVNFPGMFSSEIKSVHFTGIGGTAMASAAAAMLDKGFAVTGSDQNVYRADVSFLAAKKIAVMNGYAERNLAHKPDLVVIGNAISRGNPEAEFVLDHKLRYCSLPALLAEFFIRGKRSHRRRRHARQDHDDLAADVGVRAQRAESELSHRRHPEQFFARARGSRTANGSSSRATNTTPHFSTSAASSSITSRKSPSSTTSNSITRTFLKIWTRSRKPSRISSGSCRATACCSATATTRTSRRC